MGLLCWKVQLNLDSAVIKGCTINAITVGRPFFLSGGPQVGHATITKTDISDYRGLGIVAATSPSTLTVSRSKIVAAENLDVAGQIGILVGLGAKGTITHNKVSGNLCPPGPDCGPDFFNQLQAFGITFDSGAGSVVSNNDVYNNDVGIGVFGNGGKTDKITHNKLTDNPFFGLMIVDGNHTVSFTKISGGDVGVAAIATAVNTVATLDHIKIVDATTPLQELSCCGFTAEIVTIPPNSFQTAQVKSAQQSSEVQELIKKKFGEIEDTSISSSPVNPF